MSGCPWLVQLASISCSLHSDSEHMISDLAGVFWSAGADRLAGGGPGGGAMTFEDSGYSMGEADALLGPLLGVDPADLIEWTLIAFTNDDEAGSMLRVGSSAEGNVEIVRMLATAIAQIADDLTEEE